MRILNNRNKDFPYIRGGICCQGVENDYFGHGRVLWGDKYGWDEKLGFGRW